MSTPRLEEPQGPPKALSPPPPAVTTPRPEGHPKALSPPPRAVTTPRPEPEAQGPRRRSPPPPAGKAAPVLRPPAFGPAGHPRRHDCRAESVIVHGWASTWSESRPPALAGSGASPAAAGTPLAGSVVATAAALAAAGADDARERDVKVLKKILEPDIDKKEGRDDNVDVVADDAGCQPGAATTTTMRAVGPTTPTSPARELVPVFEGDKVIAVTWRELRGTPSHDDVPAPPRCRARRRRRGVARPRRLVVRGRPRRRRAQ